MADECWRTRLPDRRQAVTHDVAWGERQYTVTVGFDAAGAPREVFADGAKEGSAMAAILADACVVISLALQAGVPPDALGRSLGEDADPATGGARPASVVGMIVSMLETDAALARIRMGDAWHSRD